MDKARWLTPAQCAAMEPRGYIVKGLLAPRDLALIFGGPGLGKSCLAPLLAYAIAQGRDVFGRRVRQGRVLYVASEDPHGMRGRFHALLAEYGDTTDLMMADGLAGFMERDSEAEAELARKVAEFRPVVVVLDTIAAGFHGLKENESSDEGMGRVIAFARNLIWTYGVAVALLHHVPKGDAMTPRGHGLLHGDADVALALSRDDRALIRATFTKNRNGPSDGALAFTIRAVTLDTDPDGDPITAPIAEPAEAPSRTTPRLPPQARTALSFLHDLIAAEGKPLPPVGGFPTGLHGVEEARWREECDTRRLSTAEEPDTRKRAFRDAFQKLRHCQLVAARNRWVWATRPEEPI